MAAHLTEEEQIEAVKRWWKENGKMTVAVILAAIIGWFGWNSWQDRQQELAEQASSQYAELVAVATSAPGASLTDEQQATAKLLAEEIIEKQSGSLYANFAALLLGKLAMEDGNLDEAEAHLRQVVGEAANPSMAKLANLRLARVLSAAGDHNAALALLADREDGFRAAYAEARGDIHVAQNQLDLARTAYEQALASLAPQDGRSGLVQLKLDNTRIAGAETSASDSPAPVDAQTEGDA